MNKLKTKTFIIFLFGLLFFSATDICAQNAWSPKYTGDIHVGYGTTSKVYGMNTYLGRVMLGTTQGVAFGRYGHIGLGVDGVMLTHYYRGQGMRCLVNPYFSVRPTFPLSRKFSLFIESIIGASIPVANLDGGTNEFTYQFGPGMKINRLTFSFGVQGMGSGQGSTTFYAKLGIDLGKQ